jgi:hypothetical protein
LENICIRHEIDAVKEVEYWKCTFNLMCIWFYSTIIIFWNVRIFWRKKSACISLFSNSPHSSADAKFRRFPRHQTFFIFTHIKNGFFLETTSGACRTWRCTHEIFVWDILTILNMLKKYIWNKWGIRSTPPKPKTPWHVCCLLRGWCSCVMWVVQERGNPIFIQRTG